MQRASASQPSSPSSPDGPATKKQRLSQGSYKSAPPSTPRAESQALSQKRNSEEHKRAAAVERDVVEGEETRWYLSFKEPQVVVQDARMRVVQAGFSALDAAGPSRNTEGEDIMDRPSGRRSFGKFNKILENPNVSETDSESEDSDEFEVDQSEADQDEDDINGANAMIREARKIAADKLRAERKAKKRAEKTEAIRLADERRKRQVKLNGSVNPSGVSAKNAKAVE
nr:hypothetical protein CFP56_30074 [Quercus suber]